MDIDLNKSLYASCRVRTGKVIGSATVVASHPEGKGFGTYALTNHHVIEDLIRVKKEFDPLVGKEVPRELKAVAEVDFPRFEAHTVLGYNSVQADVVIYDKQQDIALLKFRDTREYPHADLIPKAEIPTLAYLQAILTIGAALGEHPIGTSGFISGMQVEIDNFDYWLGTANSVFGHSGGGIFTQVGGAWRYIGIPSRITVMPLGWGVDVVSFMGFFIPPTRIHGWLESVAYEYLYDPAFTKEECDRRREAKRQDEIRKLLLSPEAGPQR